MACLSSCPLCTGSRSPAILMPHVSPSGTLWDGGCRPYSQAVRPRCPGVGATSAGDQVSRSAVPRGAVSRGAVSRSAQKCPEASGPVVRRPETALGADATELFDRPVRLAEMVLGTSPGAVTVAGL